MSQQRLLRLSRIAVSLASADWKVSFLIQLCISSEKAVKAIDKPAAAQDWEEFMAQHKVLLGMCVFVCVGVAVPDMGLFEAVGSGGITHH